MPSSWPSTVSYVLSGRRPISAETRARVQAAIAELGFHPHAGARALASSRTNVLALVAPLRVGVNVPVIMQFATAVVTCAMLRTWSVRLLASWFTFSVRSRQVPATPCTSA